MALVTRNNWILYATTTARVFLASTLLLSASDMLFQFTFRGELAFSLEFVLGAAIATGWLVPYAAALVPIGIFAARFLAPQFHLASLPSNVWATTAVLIASGILVCCGRNDTIVDAAPIRENNKLRSHGAGTLLRDLWDEDIEITIRLENRDFCNPHRQRCIVTADRRVACATQGERRGMPEITVNRCYAQIREERRLRATHCKEKLNDPNITTNPFR